MATSALRVLIVDDDSDNANSTATLARLWGHDAKVAYRGVDALATFHEFLPHAMIVDISMPGMDGNELVRRVRQLATGTNVLLIAMTGHGYESDVRRSREAGFDVHVLKPASPDLLQEMLVTACERLNDSVVRVSHSPQFPDMLTRVSCSSRSH